MRSNDDIDWSVHSWMSFFHDLHCLPLWRLPSTVPCSMFLVTSYLLVCNVSCVCICAFYVISLIYFNIIYFFLMSLLFQEFPKALSTVECRSHHSAQLCFLSETAQLAVVAPVHKGLLTPVPLLIYVTTNGVVFVCSPSPFYLRLLSVSPWLSCLRRWLSSLVYARARGPSSRPSHGAHWHGSTQPTTWA